jgi:hypothetical protein
MSANPSFNELLEEMKSISEALTRSKQEFLDTESAYDARGTKLEQAVLKQVENYSNPENKRAKLIQQSALTLAADIKDFTRLRTELMTQLTFLLWQLNLTASSLMADALSWPAADAIKAREPIDVVRSFSRDLDQIQARLVFLAARAVIAGSHVLGALRAATNLIRLRQGKLELYLEEALTVDVDAALDAAQDILAAELREETYKAILEASAQAIGIAAETVFPILKIATISHELYDKLQNLKKRYARGEVDEVLDFSDQVHLENGAIEKDLALFESLRTALAANVP